MSDRLQVLILELLRGTITPRTAIDSGGPLTTAQILDEALVQRVLVKRKPRAKLLDQVRRICTALEREGLISSKYESELPRNARRDLRWRAAK